MPKTIREILKHMQHAGKSGLEGWIRTTWLPYTEQISEEIRDKFIELISTKYIEKVPMAKIEFFSKLSC